MNLPEPNDNIYHAHVVRPANYDTHMMALHLCHVFTTYGKFEQNKSQEASFWDRFRQHRFTRWIVARLFQ